MKFIEIFNLLTPLKFCVVLLALAIVYYTIKAFWPAASTSGSFSVIAAPTLKEQASQPRNPFLLVYDTAMWLKLRLIYSVNNWIYTTNHKRIAVNYYWFVIFSGICGMVLATIIRLEMAYPGVGILAGDSLQYLSVVTAHAVIMVFFMIMPLLFGAFGNFLLPTQLGVHDVAFPRLNSAAFWFLPAGLLMLVQLVCLDRRYQRMNCFNIREIQTILKSKYSPNSTDNADVHFSLGDTAIGLRYSLSDLVHIDTYLLTFYKNLIVNDPRYRVIHRTLHAPLGELDSVKYIMAKTSLVSEVLRAVYSDQSSSLSDLTSSYEPTLGFPYLSSLVLPTSLTSSFSSVPAFWYPSTLTPFQNWNLSEFKVYWFSLMSVGQTLVLSGADLSLYLLNTLSNLTSSVNGLYARFNDVFTTSATSLNWSTIFNSNSVLDLLLYTKTFFYSPTYTFNNKIQPTSNYSTNYSTTSSFVDQTESALGETSSDSRFMRFMNPVFKYDFKVGNYMPDEAKKMNPHLFTTIKDITTGIKKSSWFTSADYSRLLKSNIASHALYFSDTTLTSPASASLSALNADLDSTFSASNHHSTNVTFTGGFYNVFILLSSPSSVLNSRWLAVNALDQKFYRMFATGSMQQRIHANWRQLKFTREAWRCKLLAARHQNTLYKRYLNEDSVVWAVERNAKDVLPGWAMITPFSARTRFTAIGKVDIGLMGVFLVLNSSIVASANFLVTYRYLSTLNNRKMRDARSFFTEGVMVASWMMIAANPMLAIGILMLLSDRHWQTCFFDYSGGGDTVLFQHMFWFFGHPEVYVIMIPTFGFNNTILSFYLRKRVSARASLLYSMYTIAFLGFFVWGHHMYMVGLAHTTRMLFSTLTVMISVPAATKLMHWCVTLVNSTFVIELPMVFQLLFIFFFVSGGISGMAVAHTGMDILFHDSFYVVGHFHVMLAGAAMFGSFGAFYFYFPAIFGVKFSRIYGYLHCTYYLIGQLMTVVPMIWLGYAAMPRRVLDYPAALGGWHAIVSAGHMLSIAGMMAFFIMIFDSIRQGRAATRNSFGVARFNTRLNFYIYEGARTWFLQRKGWYLSRFNRNNSVRLNTLNYTNHEFLETTLYTYVILKK